MVANNKERDMPGGQKMYVECRRSGKTKNWKKGDGGVTKKGADEFVEAR
jgi:hypothetical protein